MSLGVAGRVDHDGEEKGLGLGHRVRALCGEFPLDAEIDFEARLLRAELTGIKRAHVAIWPRILTSHWSPPVSEYWPNHTWTPAARDAVQRRRAITVSSEASLRKTAWAAEPEPEAEPERSTFNAQGLVLFGW